MTFDELAYKLAKQKGETSFEGSLLSFDPGKTTGFAAFDGPFLVTCGQLDTSDLISSAGVFMELFKLYDPRLCVVEDYRVYKHKQKQHAWSELHTAKLIGVIEGASYFYEGITRVIKQPAHIAKGFCTDTKLKEWNMYHYGQKHARDAIRHGCYHILFGGNVKWHTPKSTNPKTTVG